MISGCMDVFVWKCDGFHGICSFVEYIVHVGCIDLCKMNEVTNLPLLDDLMYGMSVDLCGNTT